MSEYIELAKKCGYYASRAASLRPANGRSEP